MTALLPVRPTPQTGDPLTAFAGRLAEANGVTRRRVLPAHRHDVGLPEDDLDKVAALAGLDAVPASRPTMDRYFDCAPRGIFSQQHAGHIWRRTHGYVGDAALLLSQALLAAFDDGSDTITVQHLDDVALSARAHAGEADLKTATPQTSRRRHVKVPVS